MNSLGTPALNFQPKASGSTITPNLKDLGLALTIGGAVAVGVGSFMVFDDIPDFPEVMSTWGDEPGRHGIFKGVTMPGLPMHIHHWLLGVIVLVVGVMLMLLGLALLVKAFMLKT